MLLICWGLSTFTYEKWGNSKDICILIIDLTRVHYNEKIIVCQAFLLFFKLSIKFYFKLNQILKNIVKSNFKKYILDMGKIICYNEHVLYQQNGDLKTL